ncbi:MAG: hypothetical protein JXB30_16830 [Anaerolineae bacterium]|nr:hypothetical protein [Anaerolineae bacterium]
MDHKGIETLFCLVVLIGALFAGCAPAPADITPTATLFVPPTLPSTTEELAAPILGSISTPTPGPVTPTVTPVTITPISLATITTGTAKSPVSATSPNLPTPTPTRECVLEALFVEDVTIPDDTVVEPGETFTKTWRVENAGNCNWASSNIVLVFLWGTQMAEEEEISVPSTKAGDTVDISIRMTAPMEPGVHVAMWQLQTADGQQVGVQLYLRIVVQTYQSPPSNT